MSGVSMLNPLPAAGRSIDGFSIFGLVIVLLSLVPLLFPIKISLGSLLTRLLRKVAIHARLIPEPFDPSTNNRQIATPWHVLLDLTSSPPLGVLVLLVTTTIDGKVVRAGIVGEGDSKPYDVLVLFICLAYIATALDSTGALRSLAFFVSNHSSGSGLQLYLALYCFFFVFGIIFGNDPIILSGTAFLTYFLKNCGVSDPTAWIFMEFIASNVASAVLVSSNPTNVLLAQAFDLNFLAGFTKYTILPSLSSAIIGFFLLYIIFKTFSVPDTHVSSSPPPHIDDASNFAPHNPSHANLSLNASSKFHRKIFSAFKWIPRANYIPDRLHQPKVPPWSALVDPQGAFFHGILMVATLITLVGTSFLKSVSVWQVTLPAGVLALVRDIVCDIRSQSQKVSSSEAHGLHNFDHNATLQVQETSVAVPHFIPNSKHVEQKDIKSLDDEPPLVTEPRCPVPSHTASRTPQVFHQNTSTQLTTGFNTQTFNSSARSSEKRNLATLTHSVTRHFPTTSRTLKNLPLPLLPFAVSMFILISSLGHLGWVRVFARWLARWCTTPARTVYSVGFLGSMILCPFFGTNIGATILLVNIISDDSFRFSQNVIQEPKILQCAVFAAAMASNIGAFSLTVPSSLAGLLWRDILKRKEIVVRNRAFLGWNLIPVLFLSSVSFTIVLVEILYIFES
ncbi:hypothetical protein O181_008409 [Austropuccinia psidii MF-1]|uniref:Citrate transporter-like domain-containing protein n=1 Tax=Austropuccinia psidii MF-1 TaxID=1389203 RepID=A0A9Q3BNT4_9BASI|nr:hypothetical protein [Austropuccinia psidii MF-1]